MKSLQEIGSWRCNACGILNGEVDEGKKLVEAMKEKMNVDADLGTIEKSADDEADTTMDTSGILVETEDPEQVEADSDDDVEEEGEKSPADSRGRQTRSGK